MQQNSGSILTTYSMEKVVHCIYCRYTFIKNRWMKKSSNLITDTDKPSCVVTENLNDSDEEGMISVVVNSKYLVKLSDGKMVNVNDQLPAGEKATPSNRFTHNLKSSGTKIKIKDFF